MVYLAAPDFRYTALVVLMTLLLVVLMTLLDGARYLRDELSDPTVPRVVL